MSTCDCGDSSRFDCEHGGGFGGDPCPCLCHRVRELIAQVNRLTRRLDEVRADLEYDDDRD